MSGYNILSSVMLNGEPHSMASIPCVAYAPSDLAIVEAAPLGSDCCRHTRHYGTVAAIASSGIIVASFSGVSRYDAGDADVVTSVLAFSVTDVVTMADVFEKCMGAQDGDCLGVESAVSETV